MIYLNLNKISLLQTTSHISGQADVFVISKDVKTGLTSSRRTSSVGSGLRIARSSAQPTEFQTAGVTTLGAPPGTRSCVNQTTLNSISTVRMNRACPSSITSTMTGLHGTTLRATTRSLSFAKTTTNY